MNYKYKQPKAITMWDFSWLERRWAGAGYEDWEQALDELTQRGYDAVRIDAYPHLLEKNPEREWTLMPEWDQQVWGAPAITRVDHIKENLLEFISVCKRHNVSVGLSSWFRQDIDNTRMEITSPQDLAKCWLTVLDAIEEAGLCDAILYVDLCNEYPATCWIPFINNDAEYKENVESGKWAKDYWISRENPIAVRWMKESIDMLREKYPKYDYTFSQTEFFDILDELDNSSLDFLEPHIWMANYTEFYKIVGYNYNRFDSKGYENVALKAENTYREKPEYWDNKLREGIKLLADWSRREKKPNITTECWSIVDYKDWPLLNWDWIKHLCEVGVETAVNEGRWIAMATSNFCGPQFVGMWRDVEWHKRMTTLIKNGKLPEM